MKRTIIAGLVIAAAGAMLAAFGPGESGAGREDAAARFERLKTALVGDWAGADDDGDGEPDSIVTYRTTAGGSVLVETIFPGEPHEMISMYHMDNDKLIMTHYCMLGNQPTMAEVVGGGEGADTFHFRMTRCANLPSADAMCMAEGVLTLIDDDRFRSVWTSYQGEKAGDPHTFEWTRVTAADAIHRDMQRYFVITLATPDGGPVTANPQWASVREGHLASIGKLMEEGRLVAAGPFEGFAGGMSIVRADSIEDAEAIAQRDPAVKSGLMVATVKPWMASSGFFAAHP